MVMAWFAAYSSSYSVVSWPLWLQQLWIGPARVSELRPARGLTVLGHRKRGTRAYSRHGDDRIHRGRLEAEQVGSAGPAPS